MYSQDLVNCSTCNFKGKKMLSDVCSKCKKIKESNKKRYCLKCHASYMRKWRKTHPLTPEQRFKNNVRGKTRMRIKRGLLIPQPCEVCGTLNNIEAHHDDYNKTYEVRWLCFTHHREHHFGKNEKIIKPRKNNRDYLILDKNTNKLLKALRCD